MTHPGNQSYTCDDELINIKSVLFSEIQYCKEILQGIEYNNIKKILLGFKCYLQQFLISMLL